MTKIKGCSVIYKPGGRALEYADLAVNLFRGCNHGCQYCFAPSVLRMKKDEFHNKVQIRKDILKKLERDALTLRHRGEQRRILLCFTCDPYPNDWEACQLTRMALEILKGYGLNIQVLTKGGMRATKDLSLFTPNDAFATTMTMLDKDESRRWEPKAATPFSRTVSMKGFHDAGIPVWCSLEPVIYPEQTLHIIKETASFVDLFKVGKLNYAGHLPLEFRQQVEGVDWAKFALDAVELLESLGKSYLIKDDLKAYLPEVTK